MKTGAKAPFKTCPRSVRCPLSKSTPSAPETMILAFSPAKCRLTGLSTCSRHPQIQQLTSPTHQVPSPARPPTAPHPNNHDSCALRHRRCTRSASRRESRRRPTQLQADRPHDSVRRWYANHKNIFPIPISPANTFRPSPLRPHRNLLVPPALKSGRHRQQTQDHNPRSRRPRSAHLHPGQPDRIPLLHGLHGGRFGQEEAC
jgi:hypothetical protein